MTTVGPWERRSRRTVYENDWLEIWHDEDPLAGARRELAEETGAAATTWRTLCRFMLQDSFSDERGVMYLATGVTRGEPRPDGTEDIDVRWVPFTEALAMVDDGTIEDAMSQLGLLRADRARLS